MGQIIEVDGKRYETLEDASPDQIQALEKFIRDKNYRERFEAKGPVEKAATIPGQGINTGLANFIGMPADVMAGVGNAILNAPTQRPDVEPYSAQLGVPETTRFEDPVGGSESIKSMLAKGNMTYPSLEAVPKEYRPLARASETVGESLPGAALPFIGAARVPAAAKSAKGVFAPIVNVARDAPRKAAFVEATSTGGAAIGSGIAESLAPGNPWARMGGELGLGMASPLAIFGKTAGAIVGRARGAVEQLKGTFDPVYGAAKHIQENAALFGETPQQIVKDIRAGDTGITGLPMGARSGSLTLNALEHKLFKMGDAYSVKHGEIIKRNIQEINATFRELQEIGSPEALQELAKLRQQHYDNMLEAFEQNAVIKAQSARESVIPASPESPAMANLQANKILRESLTDARGHEKIMWGKVPKNLDVPQEGLADAWKSAHLDLLPGERLHLSGPVRAAYIKAMKGKKPPKSGQLKILRTRIGNEIRLERGDGLGKVDFDRIRRLTILKGQIDNSIAKVSPEAADARDFSVAMHDRFTRSYAGEVLGRKPTGEEAIKSELTLERGLVAGQGPAKAVVSKELETAAAPFKDMAENPQRLLDMREAEEQIIRRMAQRVVDPVTGEINATRLLAFQRDNFDLLQRFPEFDKVLGDAAIAEQVYGRRLKRIQKTRDMRNRMAFTKILGAEDADVVFRDALNGRFPVRDTSSIFQTASRTPQARAGARTAYLEHLFTSSVGPDGLYSGEKFIENLTKSNGEILNQAKRFGILSDPQIDRLMQIAGESKRLEASMKFKGDLASVMENPNTMIDLLSRLVGANLGGSGVVAKSSGAGLVMASAGSRYVRKLTEKIPAAKITQILQAAVEDKDLMITLLEKPVSAGKAMTIAEKLRKQLTDKGIMESGKGALKQGAAATGRAVRDAIVTPPIGYKLQAGIPAEEDQ